MPIVSVSTTNPFIDGRQSERAMTIRNGVERHFTESGWVALPELTLKDGRRADLFLVSPKGEMVIIEVKSSIADFQADNKWPDYRAHSDFLYFATLPDVPAEIFPEDAGLIVADNYGAEILREAPEHKLNAARRKSLMLRFARASAQRLARLCAHAGIESRDMASEGEG